MKFQSLTLAEESEMVTMKNNAVTFNNFSFEQFSHEYFITKMWINLAFPIAAAGLLVTFFFLIYVCVKIYDGTLVGNQSLGIVLLITIMVLYLNVLLSVPSPTLIKCSLRQIGFSLTLTLGYAILLLKVMQLRSLVLLGLGGRISYLNLYVVLFFIELVQVVLVVNVIISKQQMIIVHDSGNCSLLISHLIIFYGYPGLLAAFSFVYGLSGLKIRRNHKEGHWITLACGLSVIVMLFWSIMTIIASSLYHELISCICILLLSTIILVVIYLPKLSKISKQDRDAKKKIFQSSNGIFSSAVYKDDYYNKFAVSDYITSNPIYEVSNLVFS